MSMPMTILHIAIDKDGRPWPIDPSGQVLGVDPRYPLAQGSGLAVFHAMVQYGQVWTHLTKAQRRTLRDPATGTKRPTATLVDRKLLTIDGERTTYGRVVLWAGARKAGQ